MLSWERSYVWLFPPFSELSGVLSRDWWRQGHMIDSVWFFPAVPNKQTISCEGPKSGEIVMFVGSQRYTDKFGICVATQNLTIGAQ